MKQPINTPRTKALIRVQEENCRQVANGTTEYAIPHMRVLWVRA